MSALSRASGVSVATLKYYRRAGLLPPGTTTARNQAEYSDRHLRRIRLVRALQELGGLRIEAIREVVGAIDDEQCSLHEVLGVAQQAISSVGPAKCPELAEVDDLLRQLGWGVSPGAPARHELARALGILRDLGSDVTVDVFLPYAHAVEPLAEQEVGGVPADGATDEAVEYLVVGTVVYGAALAALRRLAHEHHSAQRYRRRAEPS